MNENESKNEDQTRVAAQLFVLSDGTPQMLYVGKVPQSQLKIETQPGLGKNMIIVPEADGFITVHECRVIRTILVPAPQGIAINNSTQSIGMASGGVMIRIKPTMYYWAGQNDSDFAAIVKSIDQCELSEREHRAKAAGLALPRIGRLVE